MDAHAPTSPLQGFRDTDSDVRVTLHTPRVYDVRHYVKAVNRRQAINEMAAYLAGPTAGVNVPPVSVQRNSDGNYLVFSMAMNAKTLYQHAVDMHECDSEDEWRCDRCADDAYDYIPDSVREFDNSIRNLDRHTGNMLIDEFGTLWAIDHESGDWDESPYRSFWTVAESIVNAL